MAITQLESGVYYIQNVGTGTVLDLASGSGADNTHIQGHTKRVLSDRWVPAQLWVITQSKDTTAYTIENTQGGTFMDIPSNNQANGTPIVGYHPTGNNSQHWIITLSTDKTAYVIKNEATGTYVDLFGGGAIDGTPVNGWRNNDSGPSTKNKNQLWHIVRA